MLAMLGCVATCVAAVALSATAPQLKPAAEASEEQQQSAWYSVASDEPSLRKSAAKSFPTDPWSQDDDFHNQEFRRAQGFASSNTISVGSVLRAIDEGMRRHWPHAPTAETRATVPPCRPRPIY